LDTGNSGTYFGQIFTILFENVGDEKREYGFFQQDGAIIHIANNLIPVLYNIFGD
jgi:hypothetical protein